MILGILPGESYHSIRALADLSVYVNKYQHLLGLLYCNRLGDLPCGLYKGGQGSLDQQDRSRLHGLNLKRRVQYTFHLDWTLRRYFGRPNQYKSLSLLLPSNSAYAEAPRTIVPGNSVTSCRSINTDSTWPRINV